MEKTETINQIVDSIGLEDVYIPSQVDRKKASFMYILLGMLIFLSQKGQDNVYLSYHLRQSIGLWVLIFVSLPIVLVFSFIPIFRYLISFLLILIEFVILGYCIKMAWDGKYSTNSEQSSFLFFYKLGDWVVELFK